VTSLLAMLEAATRVKSTHLIKCLKTSKRENMEITEIFT